ncbi:MAG: flippase-like domain-containing protein [Chloroflexi bacterium]|nr:flippase-like domain-containing protein [Chloroflexota bacterium]
MRNATGLAARLRYRIITVSLILISAALAVVAMRAIWQSLALSSGSFRPVVLIWVLPFACWSFGLRLVRWHTLLRRLAPALSVRTSGYTQLVGFALAVTPGRIAELYKLKLLEQTARVPVAQSLPAIVVERITDLTAFGLLVLIGGTLDLSHVVARNRALGWATLGIGVIIAAILIQQGQRSDAAARITRRLIVRLRRWGGRWISRLPGAQRLGGAISELQTGGARIGHPLTLALALACVTIGRLGDGVILWEMARVVGYPVSYPAALLMIGSAGLVGGLSLAPGGMGTAEATLIGLIVAHGAPLGPAVVAAVATRLLIFWLWVVIGLAAFLLGPGKPTGDPRDASIPESLLVEERS